MDELENKRLSKIKDRILRDPELMIQLSSRERDVLRLRLGLDDGQFRDIATIAELFGVAGDRIKLIESKALRKLGSPGKPG